MNTTPQPPAEALRVCSLRLPRADWEALGEIAETQGKLRSDLLRDVLEAYLRRHRQAPARPELTP